MQIDQECMFLDSHSCPPTHMKCMIIFEESFKMMSVLISLDSLTGRTYICQTENLEMSSDTYLIEDT